MEAHNKTTAEKYLTELNITTAEHMEKDDFRTFVDGLKRQAQIDNGEKEGGETLDRNGLAQLRGRVKQK